MPEPVRTAWSPSLAIGTLPYLTPVASVLALWLILGQGIRPVTWVALLVVVGANVAMHLWRPGRAAREVVVPPTEVLSADRAH